MMSMTVVQSNSGRFSLAQRWLRMLAGNASRLNKEGTAPDGSV
jgi:hypothetical protein